MYWNGNFDQVIEAIKNGLITEKNVKFFLGYSGWEAGQLDKELNSSSWIIQKITTVDVLKSEASKLWKSIVSNSGEEISMMANFPEDPSLN